MALAASVLMATGAASDTLKTVQIDFAAYNPLSLVLKEKHFLEDALGPDIKIEWSEDANTMRSLERLRAHFLDVASSAGSSALLARANGNLVKIVYVYSKPEWTALVVTADSPIQSVADLKGKRVAATSGGDSTIFLWRSLAGAGLGAHDLTLVPLQAADGRIALERGQVDAWVGIDPYIAEAELETHDRLVYRNPEFSSYGVVALRDAFVKSYPDAVTKLVGAYERARIWAASHKDEFAQVLVTEAHVSPTVAARQLERTDISNGAIGDGPRQAIAALADTLKEAAIVPPDCDLDKVETDLLDPQFTKQLAGN
jgi:sulfonate transport system substrate-binding protein